MRENEKLTVFAEGRIDTSTSPAFDTEVKGALEGVTELVIDCRALEYVSSSGLRVLLNLHKIMSERNGTLTIKSPTKMVSEVLEITRFADILTIEQ